MVQEILEILCHECKCVRFRVIKPSMELPEGHIYFQCTNCVAERNRKRHKMSNLEKISESLQVIELAARAEMRRTSSIPLDNEKLKLNIKNFIELISSELELLRLLNGSK